MAKKSKAPVTPRAGSHTPFEYQIHRLDAILHGLWSSMEELEKEDFNEDAFQANCIDIAKALSPMISDEEAAKCASVKLIPLAYKEAYYITMQLFAGWELAKGSMKHDVADVFVAGTRHGYDDSGRKLPIDDLVCNLPWLLRGAFDFILSDSHYKEEPTSGTAIGARVLACIVDRLEQGDGDFNSEPPESNVVPLH